MDCKLTEPLSEMNKKKYKNFRINHNNGNLVFINPMLKVSKTDSRKHKRSN